MILNAHVPLVEAAELERPEIDVPYSVVDFLKANVLAGSGAALLSDGKVREACLGL